MLGARLEFELTHVLWSHDHSGPEDDFVIVANGVFAAMQGSNLRCSCSGSSSYRSGNTYMLTRPKASV
jgi:sulfur transfer complex TusBCD TusB component (DsrH family)